MTPALERIATAFADHAELFVFLVAGVLGAHILRLLSRPKCKRCHYCAERKP